MWFLFWLQQYLIDESDLYMSFSSPQLLGHSSYSSSSINPVLESFRDQEEEGGEAMGGGNGQKSKMARQRNMEKQKNAAKGSQLESNKKSMTIQCKVCMQVFICTTSEVKCREHAEAKHPKSDVYTCFPHLQK